MIILIHNICIAFKGLGSFKNVEIVISDIAAILLNQKTKKLLYWLCTQLKIYVCDIVSECVHTGQAEKLA